MQQASESAPCDSAPWRTGLPVLFEPRPHARRYDLSVALLVSFAGACLGCFATLHLSALGLPPALASAAVTVVLCAGLVIASPGNLAAITFSSSVYGGSFSGMTPIAQLSDSVARTGLPQESSLYLLSIFCGLLFCIFTAIEIRRRVVLLEGYGGRLGVLAAFGSLLFVTLGPWLAGQGDTLHLRHLTQFDQELDGSLAILAACLAGTFLTLFIQRLPHVADAGRAARTFVSATLAFAGMAIMQALWPDQRCLVDAYYAGCFLGMSSPQRLSGLLQPIVAALTLAVVLVQASTVLPMVGGSLGLAAFIAVATVDIAKRAGNALPAPALSMKAALGPSVAVALAVAGCLLPSHLFFGLADDTTDAPREAAAVLAPALVTLPDEPIVNATAPEAASLAPVAPAVALEPALLVGAQVQPVALEVTSRVEAPAEAAPAPRAELPRTQRAKRAGAGPSPSPANAGPWGIIRAGELGRTGAVGARPRAKPAPVRSVDAASAAPQPAARAQLQSAPKRTARAVATAAPE
ncbi:conserved membrane protein of unknown function [Bradyrhizobium sp. ORS 285]|uniref:hypothetical protein n=1 Tax=Bradyrhizobium sp. ORS 285 TaxID=115808 RepID=UPI000240A00B|nr:hypothetical protein [Bradyrhizobium sp. ORS 285]CCD86396.1 conserved membrane hypothetical protein [Bradyrhizobium sp. ORS 285]SMX61137.1 conserved membrane protein of unknown function [Bradyrhizobium sp. ORS 285]